ncbi:hypothetical protein S40285_02150 [Stachybotrys chlorohalonatus IBT 40285]|uniref:Cytochrome c oxidase assembly protein COX20, mitochondrial n=1 Tax=Stachybotrys chlorohalonatus (strain IBT 40285) TaxID=1283841 RepID=A0A084QDJ4_STAC4|nr:hypothetical protein S40285_02150 [Stachybotrys chlorohalonata IBT 40285]
MAPSDQSGPAAPNSERILYSRPIDQTQPSSAVAPPPPGKTSVQQVLSEIKPDDFAKIGSTPCAGQGFLSGIGAGAGLGGLRFIQKGSLKGSANWAVGAFLLGSIVSYEYCQYRRRAERIALKREVEIVNEQKRQEYERVAEERRKQEAQQALLASPPKSGQPWYKFW